MATKLPPVQRPGMARQETDQFLAYYRSEEAGQSYSSQDQDRLREAAASPESVYSHESSEQEQPLNTIAMAGSGVQRRPSQGSASAMDKRRLAIVEMDERTPVRQGSVRGPRSPNSGLDIGSTSSNPSLLSRRGHDASHTIALVAPPDASSLTYTDLSPPVPMTAPAIRSRSGQPRDPSPSPLPNHQRSVSDLSSIAPSQSVRRKTSRDVGIVGLGHIPSASDGLSVAVFQTPTRHSITPGSLMPDIQATPTQPQFQPSARTPEIGESKDLNVPVVGPVVVGITPAQGWLSTALLEASASTPLHSPGASSSYSSTSSAGYLGYIPGRDAGAGALPPPPRAMFDIDRSAPAPPRPPRVSSPPPRSPYRQRLELKDQGAVNPRNPVLSRTESDYSIVARSVASSDDEKPSSSFSRSDGLAERPSHVREGASAASSPSIESASTATHSVIIEPATPAKANAKTIIPLGNSLSRSPPMTPDSGNGRLSVDSTMAAESSSKSKRLSASQSDSGHSRLSTDTSPSNPLSRSTSRSSDNTPKSLKRAMTKWKRFSALPRTPSRSPAASVQGSSPRSSLVMRSPSPSPTPLSTYPSPAIHSGRLPAIPSAPPKKIAAWPSALQFADVTNKKSSLERSIGYAQKINELYMYDCGLTNWIITTTGTRDRKSAAMPDIGMGAPPVARQASFQQRVVSDASVRSNATFRIRADAYLATDLGVKLSDVPQAPGPALPYPSLANIPLRPSAPPINTSFSTASTASSSRSIPKSGGFFLSMGRKSSTRRDKERGLLSPNNSALSHKLSKAPPVSPALRSIAAPTPAPAALQTPMVTGAAAIVPGGPRAAPRRAQRSQTLMLSPSPVPDSTPSSPGSNSSSRRSAVARRPSMFAPGSDFGSGSLGGSVSGGGSAGRRQDWDSDPSMSAQVDILVDLLPHADRNVLAGYLRRAGSDLVALGQYIEDEKTGNIRYN